MTPRSLHLLVPGPLNQRTGGYVYDARMVEGLREQGWRVTAHELAGAFPGPDDEASRSLAGTLSALDDGTLVVIDGLALGAHPEAVGPHADRLVVVALVHHPLAEETGLSDVTRRRLRHLETEALAACRGVVVTSGFSARGLARYAVPVERVRVVEPGVDPAPMARGPGGDRPPQLLCVASVTPRKGQDVLVRALARLSATRWGCVCAGSLRRSPSYAQEVRSLIGHLGLTRRVQLTDELGRAELDRLYATSTLFVLPSYYEGYGMVLTEALARGLPIVATTGGAIPATVEPDAAVLVAPGDEVALAEAIEQALSPPRLQELATAARRHRATLRGWDEAVDRFQTALTELADRGGGRR